VTLYIGVLRETRKFNETKAGFLFPWFASDTVAQANGSYQIVINTAAKAISAIVGKMMISAMMSLIGSLPGTVAPPPSGRMKPAPSFGLYRFAPGASVSFRNSGKTRLGPVATPTLGITRSNGPHQATASPSQVSRKKNRLVERIGDMRGLVAMTGPRAALGPAVAVRRSAETIEPCAETSSWPPR
jgi:hypothetical protein